MLQKISIRKIAFAGVIAALYATLTVALAPIAYGPFQFRIAEALCILPFFFPITVPGLFVGCLIANMLSPYGILDVVVGSAASLLAALCTMLIGRLGREKLLMKVLACIPPVIINAVCIGAVIAYYMVSGGEVDTFFPAFVINGLQVGLGQLVVLYTLGLSLLIYLPKTKAFNRVNDNR